jgi:N-hydroxyarylamine O-acetyltransferase
MDVSLYLDRIGLPSPPRLNAGGLAALHRAHAYAIPYEGLDIQLGRPVDLDPARIFAKLVTARRGGWCYENNGLLGQALTSLGFAVRRCTAGVYRRERGDAALGNHLALAVTLEEEWLCDLGLGDGLRAPIPLREGDHHDGPLTFRLERLPDGYWRFHNHADGSPETFDFLNAPADEALFERQCARLQTDPESHFVLNAEAIRMTKDASVTLLGRVLRRQGPSGLHKTLIEDAAQMQHLLAAEFGITGVDCAAIWPQIAARHDQLFAPPTATP